MRFARLVARAAPARRLAAAGMPRLRRLLRSVASSLSLWRALAARGWICCRADVCTLTGVCASRLSSGAECRVVDGEQMSMHLIIKAQVAKEAAGSGGEADKQTTSRCSCLIS